MLRVILDEEMQIKLISTETFLISMMNISIICPTRMRVKRTVKIWCWNQKQKP